MNLQEFIEKYEKEAMKIQLNPNVLEVLNEKREAISNPDFEEEKENAYKTAKKMVEYQKKRLRHFIRLNFDGDRLKGYYKGGTPPHLFDLRIYLEYKKLLPKNPIKKETLKDKYLYDIGLKLATGELDEYLTFNKDGKCTGANMSYPKLATKFNLDPQHLKCTLSDSTDQSNRSKNLLYNPEIIEKVLTHLKSEEKEPKEWFLKQFKK